MRKNHKGIRLKSFQEEEPLSYFTQQSSVFDEPVACCCCVVETYVED